MRYSDRYQPSSIEKYIFLPSYYMYIHVGDSAFRFISSLNWFFMLFQFLELYEFCLKEGYADKNLIAKWKKQGYENLCCLRCIQCRDTNFGMNCICRVPKAKLEEVSSWFWSQIETLAWT